MPKPVIYWDSNVFIHYINGSREHLPTIDQLLLDARNGDIEIVTSTVAIAEVAWAASEKAQWRIDPAVEQKIAALWEPSSPINLVEFHLVIAEDARDLMRAALPHNWILKPLDAIHLATAARMQVERIHTYEPKWRKYAPMVGSPVIEPPQVKQLTLDMAAADDGDS